MKVNNIFIVYIPLYGSSHVTNEVTAYIGGYLMNLICLNFNEYILTNYSPFCLSIISVLMAY